jgi:uncharacterized Fe-S center protein
VKKELCIGCAECVIYCNQEAITTNWSSSITTLQERMVEYAYGAVKNKGTKVAFINFLTEISLIAIVLPGMMPV